MYDIGGRRAPFPAAPDAAETVTLSGLLLVRRGEHAQLLWSVNEQEISSFSFSPSLLSSTRARPLVYFRRRRLFASARLNAVSGALPCCHSQETGEVDSEAVQLLLKREKASFLGTFVTLTVKRLNGILFGKCRWSTGRGGKAARKKLKQVRACVITG